MLYFPNFVIVITLLNTIVGTKGYLIMVLREKTKKRIERVWENKS